MVAPGGHVWLLPGGCVQLLQGGHAWLLPGGMCGCCWGACMVALGWGGVWLLQGACMVTLGGMRGCYGGHAWLLWGVCVVAVGGGMHGIRRDTEIRSMSGRYASYWNAFLFKSELTGIVTGSISALTNSAADAEKHPSSTY